ncbi:MAG TPA: DUF948 domain-containing protein [Syntrophorhabdaceae bacterium]|nr:DUF948 domain-containing protein [Syntrophorhabdaceae bacterium]
MNSIFLGIIAMAFLAASIVFIYFLLVIKKKFYDLEKTVKTIEESLLPATEELPKTLMSIKNFADNMTYITEDLKELSGSLRIMADNIRNITSSIEKTTRMTSMHISGFKAGINAAFNVIKNHYFKKGDKK